MTIRPCARALVHFETRRAFTQHAPNWSASAVRVRAAASCVVVTTASPVVGAASTINTSFPCRQYSSTTALQASFRHRRRKKGMDLPQQPGQFQGELDVKVVKLDDGSTSMSAIGKHGKPAAEWHHDAVTDPELFQTAAAMLMEEVYKALVPLKRFNDNFILTRGANHASSTTDESEETVDDIPGEFILIDLGIHGNYRIQIDLEKQTLLYISPVSGQNIYVLSKSTGEWLGFVDGHIFRGILVRDLIRQCNGVPNL